MRALLVFVFTLATAQIAFADNHDVFGTFYTSEKSSTVKISDCGDGSPCGRVAWVDPSTMPDGMTPETTTMSNGEPLIGLLMLQKFKKAKNDWRGGTIYDPESNQTYASRLKRLANGKLEVKGCISFLCQTQIWTEQPNAADE